MRRVIWSIAFVAFVLSVYGCTSRKEGTCEKDSHCSGAQVCFEKKCMSMKELDKLKKQRSENERPKFCKDKDEDGIRTGEGCPADELYLDCNDDDPNVGPGKEEVCDQVDNNCDGQVNEDLKSCSRTLFGGAKWGNQSEFRLDHPRSVVYDPAGFVVVTDDHHIWKVDLDGKVELLAGTNMSNFINGKGEKARFSYPHGIAKARDGGYYIADCKNNCIRKVSLAGEVITVAGRCSNKTKDTGKFADGPVDSATFYCPSDVAVAPDGTLIVVDRGNARIRRVQPGGDVSTIAGVGAVEVIENEGQDGFKDGPALEARFNDPQAVLVDSAGIIYVSESFNCRIRRIDPKKGEHGEVTTLAGDSDTMLGTGGFKDGKGSRAKFSYPHGMAFDSKGNLLVVDTGNSVIRLVTKAGKVSTVCGKPGENKYVEGSIKQVRFKTPADLAPGPDGSIFVVDTEAGRLRWVMP